jgi:outer membrane lipoprotein-sorting protein
MWILLLMSVLALPIPAQCPEMQKLREFYRQKRFVSLEFLQITRSDVFETVDTVQGTVYAGWEGRFRLTMPDQIIVSNGVLVWSYSAENRQVLIDSVRELGSWNPITLLYDPERVYTCKGQTKRQNLWELEMTAVDTSIVPRQFMLQITENEYTPKALIYHDDAGSRIEVHIDDFSRQDQLPDSLFEFRPGPGVEVIRMP